MGDIILRKEKVDLIPARDIDREFIRKLRNTLPGVSSYRHYISKIEHRTWWKNLKKRGIKTYVIFCASKKVGYVRINTFYFNEISIALLPQFRGKGIGRRVISLLPEDSYTAFITLNNTRSIKFFKKCGFKLKDKIVFMERKSA